MIRSKCTTNIAICLAVALPISLWAQGKADANRLPTGNNDGSHKTIQRPATEASVTVPTNTLSKAAAGSATSLEQVLLALSSYHPRLLQKAQELAAQMSEARSRQQSYPDPRLGLAWTNAPYRKDLAYDDQRTPMTGFEYRLMQPIPFPGRLTTVAKLADLDAQTKRLELIAEKNRLARSLLAHLIESRSQRELAKLTEDYATRVGIIARTARTRYAVGRGNLADVARADLLYSQYQDRVVDLLGQRQARARQIGYFLKPLQKSPTATQSPQVPVDSSGTDGAIEQMENDLNAYLRKLEVVRRRSVTGLPGESVVVALREVLIERGQTARSLAAFDYLPDMEVFAAYRVRANIPNDPVRGEDFFSFGVTFRIPLWSSLSTPSLRDAREQETRAARSGKRDASTEVQTMFRALAVRYDTLTNRIQIHEQRLIPQAERARDSTRQAYETGKVDFDLLLVSWDSLYLRQVELVKIRAQRDQQLLGMADLYNRILPDATKPTKATGANR